MCGMVIPNNWQWVNLDYFDLVAIEVPAEGRHEAEHSDSYTQGGAKNPPNVVINEDGDWNKKVFGKWICWQLKFPILWMMKERIFVPI